MAVLYVSDDLHSALKLHAAQNGTTLQHLTRTVLSAFLAAPFPLAHPLDADGRAKEWWTVVRFWRGEDWLEGESDPIRLTSTAQLPAVVQALAAEMFAPDVAPDLATVITSDLGRFRQLLARTLSSSLRVPFQHSGQDWRAQIDVHRARPDTSAAAPVEPRTIRR